eukprot:UN26548
MTTLSRSGHWKVIPPIGMQSISAPSSSGLCIKVSSSSLDESWRKRSTTYKSSVKTIRQSQEL